jgi:hypothetical protein
VTSGPSLLGGPGAVTEAPGGTELPAEILIGLLTAAQSGGRPERSQPDPEAAPGAGADPPEAAAPGDRPVPTISTWPPPGATIRQAAADQRRGTGPLPSRYRTLPSRRRRRLVGGVLAVVAAGGLGAGVWLVLTHRHRTAAPTWDPKVASLATFVSERTGMSWVDVVNVDFETPDQYEVDTSAIAPGPQTLASGRARWVVGLGTVFVDGPPDPIDDLAVVGQLAEAIQSQHPGAVPPPAAAAEVVGIQRAWLATMGPAVRSALAGQAAGGA